MFITASAVTSFAQTFAYTEDGKRIVLFPNGSWYYADSVYGGNNGGWYNNNVQGAQEMFTEAYDYAYELVYGEEFFRNERETKAATWAADYVKSNIQISIGRKSLGSWYDELYNIAFNHVYKNTFFGSERKQNAINWAKSLLEQKATYEWSMNNSRMQRTREAYNVALNKIFNTEFFSSDRKRRAIEWANQFVRNRR